MALTREHLPHKLGLNFISYFKNVTHKCIQQIQNVCALLYITLLALWISLPKQRSHEPIILVTEANIWCVKITVNTKWVDQYFDYDTK